MVVVFDDKRSEDTMKCPVCESEVFEYHAVCPICNYFGLHKDFANDDEASAWERYVLKYYRALWLRKKQKPSPSVQLESKEAIAVFQKYFSDDGHKYRLYIDSIQVDRHKIHDLHEMRISSAQFAKALNDSSSLFSAPEDIVDKAEQWKGRYTGIEINTKYLQIGFMEGSDPNPQTYYTYGHEHYWIEYLLEDNIVSLFLVPKKEDGLKDYLCSILFSESEQKNELITVLEFLKCGNAPFSKLFDDSVFCLNELRNEEITYDAYFRNGPIKPIVFYAEVTEFNEDNDEFTKDHGLCKITIRVSGAKDKHVPNIKDLFANEVRHDMCIDMVRMLKPNGPFGCHHYTPLRENEHNYDFYMNREQKLLYSGTLQEHIQFKFEDELLMQQVFNYLVILNTYWLI